MDTNELNGMSDGKVVDQKPCFIASSASIFTNLHKAAAEKAAKVIHIQPNSKTINQFIINTGISDDGRTIADVVEKNIDRKVRFRGKKFEVGIVLQLVNVQPILTDDSQKVDEIQRKNKKELEKAKDLIFDGLKEYFKWFMGGTNLNINDLVEFIPDYNGGKVQIKDGEILGVEDIDNKKKGFFHFVRRNEKVGDDEKLRIGYKVGYTIKYP